MACQAGMPKYPLSAQRFCTGRWVPVSGRPPRIPSRTASTCVTSWRFAPVTTSESGTPRASTRRCRLLPFFSPIRGVVPDGLPGQGRLGGRPVDRLPVPRDALHLVVLRESRLPEGQKQTGLFPFPEIAVNRAGTPEDLLRQRFPLAPGPKHVDDALEDPAGIQSFSPSARPALVGPAVLPLFSGNQRVHPLPEPVGDFPRLYLRHASPP